MPTPCSSGIDVHDICQTGSSHPIDEHRFADRRTANVPQAHHCDLHGSDGIVTHMPSVQELVTRCASFLGVPVTAAGIFATATDTITTAGGIVAGKVGKKAVIAALGA